MSNDFEIIISITGKKTSALLEWAQTDHDSMKSISKENGKCLKRR
jgi:hypothetical protein